MNERFEMGFPLPKALLHTPKQVDDGVQKESVEKCVFVVCQCFCAVNIFPGIWERFWLIFRSVITTATTSKYPQQYHNSEDKVNKLERATENNVIGHGDMGICLLEIVSCQLL